jgi:hypothetical protein
VGHYVLGMDIATTVPLDPLPVDSEAATVVALTMDSNLSGSHLMRNKWDHLYSRHALLIQGVKVYLVQAPVTQRSVSAVYTTAT